MFEPIRNSMEKYTTFMKSEGQFKKTVPPALVSQEAYPFTLESINGKK